MLDQIITSLKQFYKSPVTKPPINPDFNSRRKPSDHLVVLMEPVSSEQQAQRREFKVIERRPINSAGLRKFSEWVESCDWSELYRLSEPNAKTEYFQGKLLQKYLECFPIQSSKFSNDDKPWFTKDLKSLDRRRKREFYKHQKSPTWIRINTEFLEKCKHAKEKYYTDTVKDLKESNPGQWHSKLKRMSGQEDVRSADVKIEVLENCTVENQAGIIADHYSKISNQYDPINKDDFPDYTAKNFTPPTIFPWEVVKIIQSLNKKAATVPGDIPVKLLAEFSVELATPLAHIYNSCLEHGTYPEMFKCESVTPAPKKFPPEELADLRKISGLLNCAKIFDKILSEFIIADMASSRDPSQYGNEKNVSIQHYLIRMLHKILQAVDTNSSSEAYGVIIQMIDWSQAFDRQCHYLGIQSFIENGVRASIIPTMISYFENRKMRVKWRGHTSSVREMNGGGAQGSLPGILEYLSQNNSCAQFLEKDDRYKFIDDLSILEILNLISIGLAPYNFEHHVSSEIKVGNSFLPPENIKSQQNLQQIQNWTEQKKMKLNVSKTKYMIVNFTDKYQFNTRLGLEGNAIDEVSHARLLGVYIQNNLSWQMNTNELVKKAYKRMVMLQKLYSFSVPISDLVEIYVLYIRSMLESSAVVWHSSLTTGQELEIERVQKVALRIILKQDYESYEQALKVTNLPTLKERRVQLCLGFARKCLKNDKNRDLFPLRNSTYNTRQPEKFIVTKGRTDRFRDSAIPYMQKLLNKHM